MAASATSEQVALLTHDQNYIYTFAVAQNKPVRAVKLRKLNISGYIVDRQVMYNPALSHVGLILGIEDGKKFPNDLFVIAFDTSGLEIGPLEQFAAAMPVQFTRPYPYDLSGFLQRVSELQIGALPEYSVLNYNCQTFVGDLMYGQNCRTPSPRTLVALLLGAGLIILLATRSCRTENSAY